jgi:hypothetical protein
VTVQVRQTPQPRAEDRYRGGTDYDRAAFLLERPYRIECEMHGLSTHVVGAADVGAAVRQHSDEYPCHCVKFGADLGDHGCHAVIATPADRMPR